MLRGIVEPACVGTYFWGRKDARTGRARDKADWIAIPVEGVLDRELFDRAQEVRASRDPSKVKARTLSSSLLLAGVARCKCGATLGLETSGKKTSDGERPFRYYNCRCFLRSGKSECVGVRVPEETLDRAVLEHLAEKVFTVERCRKILKDVVEETGLLRKKTAAERENLKAKLADVERRIAKWTAAFEDDRSDASVILPRLRDLEAKRSELQEALLKVVPLTKPPPHLYTEATLTRFQGMLREVFQSGQTSMTKNYLRFLVERIEVQPAPKRSVEVNIVGRSGAAVALIASTANGNQSRGPVLGSVGSWLGVPRVLKVLSVDGQRDRFAVLASSRENVRIANVAGWMSAAGTLSRIRTVPRATRIARGPLRRTQ